MQSRFTVRLSAMTDQKLPKAVREYMSRMGVKGGRLGGAAKGPQKRRSPEHYAKMVAARNAQRAQRRAEREAAAKTPESP